MGQQVDDLWMGNATGPQTNSWAGPGTIGRGVGPLGRVYIFDIVPATASATAVCAAQAIAGAGNATINGASASGGVATLDVARAVNVDSSGAGDTTQTVTITGTDYWGQAQTEEIAMNGTTAVAGLKAFKTVTAVAVDGALAGNLTVGSTDVFGLPYRVTDAGYILRAGWAGALADDAGTFVAADTTSPATATTGDVRGTFDPSSAANGSRRLVLALGLTALQAGPNATQTGAIGVTPA
ncbi:MAG: hypothetical protein ACR2IJ_10070 [Fluviibacter sp.]